MRKERFYFTESLILLPLLVVLACAAVFIVRELPRLEKAEEAALIAHYREIALDVRDGEAANIEERPRMEEESQGRLGKKGTWGVSIRGETAFVWYRLPNAETCRGTLVPTLRPRPLRTQYLFGGALLVIVFLLLTDLGLRRFRRFLREREDFIAATAHDLKTPLVALRRLIGRDDVEAGRVVERMMRLVGNLTDFLQLDTRRRGLELERVDLAAAYRSAYALFADDFEYQKLCGAVPTEGLEGLFVRSDEGRLVQVLWNILGNELKYAAPYGRVTVRAEADARVVRLRFIDEGLGLSAYDRRRIFRRYYRARRVLESGKGGFGIGLSTAREFARAMGGDLIVEANHPKGCIFTLLLSRCA